MYRKRFIALWNTPFIFKHKPREWLTQIGLNYGVYTLNINGVEFSEMDEAPPRERAALARSAIKLSMHGAKKTAKFGLLRRGEYIGVTVLLNTLTKFGKLSVGKQVITARQRSPGEPIFPLIIALSGLHPLTKVWVDYEPLPKNTFVIKINDSDFYTLVKEEVDFDPTKTEALEVSLNIND